nr:toll/interleukin-1 receptor domain-containing protein [Lachnospiraceae bacterium]
MADLLYKTKNNRDPNGLTNLLFCACKEDSDKYFEELSDQILDIQKLSVIWYEGEDRDPEGIEEDFLQEIKLVIVIVTRDFLEPSCRERIKILDKAISMHIPVLPILKEKGISRIFGQMSGKLQVLDGTKTDDTRIPFEEKLEEFLYRLTNGSRFEEAVREDFEGYIFISYRKKDRKYVDMITSLIKENEAMRDIAVWYDEYLFPGETYSDLIQNVLHKSKVVILLVTPNLVNEDNYVQRVEYPEAVKSGKVIIPILAEFMDIDLLREQYSGISKIYTPDDKEKISEILLNAFYPGGYTPNNDPKHLYCMAYAHLDGIDMKKNTYIGKDMLFESAMGGYEPACSNLVSIFKYGRYFNQDYDAAKYWQRLLLERKYDEIENHVKEFDEGKISVYDLRQHYI